VNELLSRHGECQRTDTRWTCWPSSAAEAGMDSSSFVDRDLEIFRIASEHFRHDIVGLWTHSSYFLLIQGALFSVFANIIGPRGDEAGSGLVSEKQEALFIAIVGLLFAFFWGWVSWRRVKLIRRWRENVMHLDGVVDRHGIYLQVEQQVNKHWWFGPSAFTAQLPWLITAIWLAAIFWAALAPRAWFWALVPIAWLWALVPT
jgi:hypothetical protein